MTVAGMYANGAVQLDEPAPDHTPTPVLVTFLAVEPVLKLRPNRFYFDEALALTATSGITVSDAVLEERREAE